MGHNRKHYHNILAIFIPGLLTISACGCSGQKSDAFHSVESHEPLGEDFGEMSLELPMIPSTISTPEDKAGFIAIHFWDTVDFNDTEHSLDQPFMERNFVDYLTLLPSVMTADRKAAFDSLVKHASVNDEARAMIVSLGEKYLNQDGSPLKNPEYYADFRNSLRK